MNTLITVVFRILSMIPLVLVIIPLFKSYWDKRNSINGLRKTRVILLTFFTSILLENFYFIYYGISALSNGIPNLTPDTLFLTLDKLINLASYWLLYYLFSHARRHNDGMAEKNQQI